MLSSQSPSSPSLNRSIEEIDAALSSQQSFSITKVFIYQFLGISLSTLSNFFYPISWLPTFITYSSFSGFLGFFLAQNIAERQIQALIKKHSLKELCIIEDRLVHKNDLSTSLVLSKLSQMRSSIRSQKDYELYLEDIRETLKGLKSDAPEHLETFYRHIRSYNKKTLFMSLRERYYQIEPTEIEVDFWVDLYQIAHEKKNFDLIEKILCDFYQKSQESREKFISALQKKKIEVVFKSSQNISEELKAKKNKPLIQRLLMFMQLTNFFGIRFLITTADIDFYITKQLIMTNEPYLAQGLAATATFLGLTFSNIGVLTALIVSLALIYSVGNLFFKKFMSQSVQNLSFSDLFSFYNDQNSFDQRWHFFIRVKIKDSLSSGSLNEQNLETLNPADKLRLGLALKQFYFTKKSKISYEHACLLERLVELCGIESFSKHKEKYGVNNAKSKEFFYAYQKAIYYKTINKKILDMFFPMNTFNSFCLSCLVLFAPVSSCIALSLVTIFPAITALISACAMGALYLYNARCYKSYLDLLPLDFLEEQNDDFHKNNILQDKIKNTKETELSQKNLSLRTSNEVSIKKQNSTPR